VAKVTDIDAHTKYEFALAYGTRTLVYGPPGVGKTYQAVQSAKDRGQPYIKITATGGDMASEYRGMFIPAGDHFDFFYGAITRAWTYDGGKGCLLVVDEIDHAPEEVHSIFHAGLDDPDIAGMTLPNGDNIKPGPNFRCVGTMNGIPEDLPEPLADRFEFKIKVDSPPPAALALIPEATRDQFLAMIMHNDPDQRVTFRQVLAFTKHQRNLGEDLAAQLTFGSRWNEVMTALKLAR
jgi:MoxR-like ATPase